MKYFQNLNHAMCDVIAGFANHNVCNDYLTECQASNKEPKIFTASDFMSESIFKNAYEYKKLVLVGVYSPLQDAKYGHYDLQEPVIRLLAFIYSLKN